MMNRLKKMKKEELRHLLNVASGREKADLVIKHAKIVDVLSHTIMEGDIAIAAWQIAGIGQYEGTKEIDAMGLYACPGFVDSHIHIESSYLSPEEFGKLLVPHGTTTIIADPHEIVNVCGLDGLEYMLKAAENTALHIRYCLPSCVPSTPYEHAGASLHAEDMKEPLENENILGLAEFMDYVGIVNASDFAIERILAAYESEKLIDGHCPGLLGQDLSTYASVRIRGNHECSTLEELDETIKNGMYALLRQGSACKDLRKLLAGVNEQNARRCCLCSDDRQARTVLECGDIDDDLRICVDAGIDPITSVQMASLNAAECFGLYEQGAIAPGYQADIVLVDNLTDFNVKQVFIDGCLVADKGAYLPETKKQSIDAVSSSVHIKDFSKDKFKMHLKSNHVNIIEMVEGDVTTKKATATIQIDDAGEFIFNPKQDIVKVAVVERHQYTGNVACSMLKGYGLKQGAIAVSIAHDSHNIIVAGASDEEMACAVKAIEAQEGGIAVILNGELKESMPMPIAGLMSDQDGPWVADKLAKIHDVAHQELKVNESVDPIMTLSFMALPVIPEVKITDMGLFDVTSFSFIPLEA